MMKKSFVLTSLLVMLGACGAETENAWTCSFDANLQKFSKFTYSDFGPDVMATEVLGPSWYQWQSYGGGSPETEFNIVVLVFAKNAGELVAAQFIIDEDTNSDFRFIEYDNALEFLSRAQADLEQAMRDGVPMGHSLDTIEKTEAGIIGSVCPSL